MADPVLVLDGLYKSFGALMAVDGVSLDLRPGEIHALIGPNGAGKTTLLALANGALRADRGRVVVAGSDVTSLPLHARARRGMGRSFQITSIFAGFTVLENVALAVQAHSGKHRRFWRNASFDRTLNEPALVLLERVGLAGSAGSIAGRLAHGDKRVLELAMAIATRPKLLLLDEPMAGVGPDERFRLTRLLDDLRHDQPILFVEHDMDIVFNLADRISVLALGRLLASGPPEAIRDDAEVRRIYLGETA